MTDAAMAEINRHAETIRNSPYPYLVDRGCRDLADRIARGPVTLNEVIEGPLSGLSDHHFDEIQFRFVQRGKYDAAKSIAGLIQTGALREKAIKDISMFKDRHEKDAKTEAASRASV